MTMDGLNERVVVGRGFAFKVYAKESIDDEGYLICHHGIGSSAHTFALFIQELLRTNPKLGIVTFDARHHGFTESQNPVKPGPITDLDPQTLEDDLDFVLSEVLPSTGPLHILLLGHSMGGTVVARFANRHPKPQHHDYRGLIVIDAVEGYARQSLSSMHSLLNMWPKEFRSYEEAIKWHLQRGHLLRNKQSAEQSVPPLFVVNRNTGMLQWKLNLTRTESNWDSWFAGLDELFLTAPSARLLILAGIGRLDTALTRGQMQGKFQLMLVSEAGHYIHEDVPNKIALAVNEFWTRNGKPIRIIPKFGELRT